MSAKQNGSLCPPNTVLNAPTKLMKEEGYGEGYIYDHDTPNAISDQDYFPEKWAARRFMIRQIEASIGYQEAAGV